MASSVDVVSALGHGLVTSQTGPSAGYDAIDDRRFWSVGRQEGAISAGSFEVVQRAAGANMTVDVAANTGDGALVQGDSVTLQGLYRIAPHTAVINVDIAAANATNPRVDTVILEVKDDAHDVGGLNVARVRVISGTATSGATLDNRTGAAALPSSAMLLADVLVPATDTTISNSQIRDRRSWARGAYFRKVITAGNFTLSTGAVTLVDSTNLYPRIECTGNPIRVSLRGYGQHSTDTSYFLFQPWLDGARDAGHGWTASTSGAAGFVGITAEWDLLPAAGSHLIGIAAATNGATATLTANATNSLQFVIEEMVRQNVQNNATTSG